MGTALNMTNPRVDRALRIALIAAVAVCVVWTGLTAVETSAAHADVNAKLAQIEAKKSQMDTANITYRARLRVSKRVGDVPRSVPYTGTAQFAAGADAIAHSAGAKLTGIQFNTRNGANTFQCTVEGQFPALLRVVDGLSHSVSGLTIDMTDMSRGPVDPKTGISTIIMHVSGELNG